MKTTINKVTANVDTIQVRRDVTRTVPREKGVEGEKGVHLGHDVEENPT